MSGGVFSKRGSMPGVSMKPALARQKTSGSLGLGLRPDGTPAPQRGTDFDAILQEGLQSMARQVQAHHEYLMKAGRQPKRASDGPGVSFQGVGPVQEVAQPASVLVAQHQFMIPSRGQTSPEPTEDEEVMSIPGGVEEASQDWESSVKRLQVGGALQAPEAGLSSARSSISGRPGVRAGDFKVRAGEFEVSASWSAKNAKASLRRLKETQKQAVASALFHEDANSDEESVSDAASSSASGDVTVTCRARCAQRLDNKLSPLMISPNSVFRSCWDSLACLFVVYECIMIPLSFFDFGPSVTMDVIGWIVRIFWSIDFPLSCVTGYPLPGDMTEMRPQKVMRHYVKTWMGVDISMLVVDWAEVAFGGVGSLNAARMGKIIKSLRMIRMMRLWRLLNVNQLPEFLRVLIHYYFQTEVSRIVLGICKICLFLVWVNHVLACCWYGVADLSLDDGSWLLQPRFQSVEIFTLYITSYHWSLTQFAGSTDVYPSNVYERTFSVCALLLCFILSASIVSSITTSMTRLSIARSKETTKLSALKEYLKENHISSRTALRVQRNAQYAMEEQKRRTPEEDIELLGFISSPLRVELRFEITMPRLRKHAPLGAVEEESPTFVRQMCFKAMSSMMLSKADVLFVSGVPCSLMYFFTNGKLTYFQDTLNREEFYGSFSEKKTVHAGDWAAEAALWTTWYHCGTLRSRSQCGVICLDAEQFQILALQFKDAVPFLVEYGRRFVKALNVKLAEELTDLYDPEYDISALARESQRVAEEDKMERSNSNAALKRSASVNNFFSAIPTLRAVDGESFWLTGIFGRRRDKSDDEEDEGDGTAVEAVDSKDECEDSPTGAR